MGYIKYCIFSEIGNIFGKFVRKLCYRSNVELCIYLVCREFIVFIYGMFLENDEFCLFFL